MYKREKPINLKGSTSTLINNLTVSVNPEKRQITYAVAHKAAVNLVTTQADGQTVAHKQIICKEPSQAHGSSMVIQARLLHLASRTLLVITAQKGMQIFEADVSLMLYWYAFGDVNQLDRTHEGTILVFYVPTRGTNITMLESLRAHDAAICALESEEDRMVSSDDLGNIIVWQAGDRFKQISHIKGDGESCTSLGLWKGLIVASYGDGHLRVFDMETGRMFIEVAAHARWINALDVARNGLVRFLVVLNLKGPFTRTVSMPVSGTVTVKVVMTETILSIGVNLTVTVTETGTEMVVTVSEDSAVRVWQLKGADSQPSMDLKFSEFVTDLQLQGVKFVTDDGRAFACTGYDSNELIFYAS